MFQMLGNLAHLEVDLIANRGHGFHEAGGLAIRTRRSNGPLQRLLHPLSSNRYQSEIVKLENLGWGTIPAQRLFQRLHDFLTVAAFVHIDEVDDDDAAQVAKANLAHD